MPQLPLWSERITQDHVMACFTPEDGQLSRTDIAQRLHVSKKKSLIDVIEQCVADGLLKRSEAPLVNRAPIFLYERA